MGAMQNNERVPKKGKGSRGSTNNAARLDAFATRGKHSGADWLGCDPKWIQAVVVGITALGGAVTFGMARDKGAHSVTLLLDDSRKTLWFNGDEDLDEALEAVTDTLNGMAD